MYSSTGWLSNVSANKIKHSYVEGFLDVSGSAVFRRDVDISGNVVIHGTLKGTGKVGIGTDSLSGQLELYESFGSTRTATTGTLVLRHGNHGGVSSIVFPSTKNLGSDYGYITYQDDYNNENNRERSVLTIGVENDSSDYVCFVPSGCIGINTTNPYRAKMEVQAYVWYTHFRNMRYFRNNRGTNYEESSRPCSIFVEKHMTSNELQVYSDRRIKHTISEVPDNLSLQIIRDLPVKYYNYIDVNTKGEQRVIGFIAQEVYELIPDAVNIFRNEIPDEYRILEDFTWEETTDNKFKLRCDLQDCSGITYLFKVTNDTQSQAIDIRVTGNEDNSFTFEKKYSHIFLYGKEVDDFMSLDESKIFAVGISALQEIDRKQQADKARIATLETENNKLKTQMAIALERLIALESK